MAVAAYVDTRREFDHLAGIYLPVAIAVAVVVFAAILFALVRFRRRDDELPRQREAAPRAEVLYASGLALVVVGLLSATFHTQGRVDPVSPRPGLRVDVTAAKWNWSFAYPDYGIDTIRGRTLPTTLVVPSDTTVQFALTSQDVIHAFWVPEVRFKRDAFPKRTTRFDLVFDEPGTYPGRCAEFCGLEHGDMDFRVRVLARPAFERWLSRQRPAA